MSTGVFFLASKCDWRSKLEKNLLRLRSLVGSKIRQAGCELLCLSILLTPNFSCGSALNGTPGGDRWARVLCGQIGWLSEPLHRFDTGCSGSTNEFENASSWKARKNPPHAKHTTESTAARRPRPPRESAETHVPRGSPYSPASIDTGFVEIGLVQLSQSVKTANVVHTLTDTQTDRQTDRQTDGQTDRRTDRLIKL